MNPTIAIKDGRTELWQWDTGRKLQITGDISETDWIHFRLRSSPNVASVHPYQSGDTMLADIPDDLLQVGRRLIVYAYVADADGNKTTIRKEIVVRSRTKPDDYVYTPTEVKHWTDLEIRIKKLEDGGATPEQIGDAVDAYLTANPPTGEVDADSLQQAVDAYLAANPPTGEVDADSLQAAVNTALTRAKETGEFDGYTPERGTDYWTDTDKTEIVNAVLANFTDVSGVGM